MTRFFAFIFCIGLVSCLEAQVPVAEFSANQFTTCVGAPITFTDLSNYGGAGVISTNWDFGEGGSSTATNPNYTYMSAGSYTVLLTVISTGGTDFELKSGYITVFANPTAVFTNNGNGCSLPFSSILTNSSETGASITYDWNFGNSETSSSQNPPAVSYVGAGAYTQTLVVTNTATGCSTTTSQSLIVTDYSVAIDLTDTACVGEVVSMTDASAIGTDFWFWDSGDGQFSNSQNSTFTYNAAGTFPVSLTAQNTASACADVATQNIVILPLPIPDFTADPMGGCAPLAVTYTNTSAAGTFIWDFGNGSTFNGQTPPVQTYIVDGQYPVSLTMTDANGCVGTTSIANMISVAPPIPGYRADVLNGCAPLSVQFTDESIASNSVADPIVSWLWDFGDAATFNGQFPPIHVYGIGQYTVSLTITTQNGCVETVSLPNYIEVGMIDLVDFSLFPLEECAKQDITFTNLSVISTPHDPNEVIYTWDFGDGSSSNEENPVYNYPVDTGFFDIELVVEFRGCRDTLSRIDQVFIKAPISRFSTQTLYCNPTSFPVHVNVTDEAIAGAATDNVDMIWSWGVPADPDDLLDAADVFDANRGDTAHDYTGYGSYVIKQIVHNYTTGCTDSTELTIIISNMIADFALSNDTVCNNSILTLTGMSVFTDPLADYLYDMGDGGFASGDPATYTYGIPGTYTIHLVATNAAGCADSSDFFNFEVLPPPIAAFISDNAAGCLPITNVFTNFSSTQGNGVPLESFLWTFPDSTTQITNSLAASTSFIYTEGGTFYTSLIAIDEFGCQSPPAMDSMLITSPTVDFTFPPVICDMQLFSTVNNSFGYGNLTFEWNIDDIFVSNGNNYSSFFDETASPLYTDVPHSITLIATDGNGCMDSLTQTIRVDLPRADLSFVASGATANGFGEYTCPPVFEVYADSSTSYGVVTQWNWDFGDGKSSAFQHPNNTYVFPGVYTLSLSIVDEYGCTADTVLVDYLTILGPLGDIAWTAIGPACEHLYSFSATNLVFVDSIVWDLDDGTFVFDSATFSHTYSVGAFNPTGTLIDSLGCEVTYPMAALVVDPIVLSADAGPDQSFCGDSTGLEGNSDPNGMGTWTVLSGSGVFSDVNAANASVTGIGVGLNAYLWTVTNACDTISDTVEVLITDGSTLANAGLDQFLCTSMSSLEGNLPLVGNGSWTLASGSGTITDPLNPVTGVTGLGIGVNQFVWSIANVCSTSRDTVAITVETLPTVADAGPDQTLCALMTNLEGNSVAVGTGIWNLASGAGTMVDSLDPSTGVVDLALGSAIFVWTIANSCATSSDSVTITTVNAPTTALTAPDIATCADSDTLRANQPLVGTGNWNLVSGTGVISVATDSVTSVTGLSIGDNVFEWLITSLCGNSSDLMTITVETPATIADAGPDQIFCGTTVTMAANAALVGEGTWTIISGSGIVESENSPTTVVNSLGEGENIFEWRITNSCGTTSDSVTITSFSNPVQADAGPDQLMCSLNAVFEGNDPMVADGIWTLVSGAGAITTPSDSASNVTDLGLGDNVFLWTVSNLCGTSSDQVVITIEEVPTIAAAGPDQTVCSSGTAFEATAAAVGAGIWTLITGEGAITSPNSPVSTVTALGMGVNVFQWTVSNTCASTLDQVVITQFAMPSIAVAGPDQFFCGSDSTNTEIMANIPIEGNGFWSLFSGAGSIADPLGATTSVSGLAVGQNVFQWNIANGCGNSFDQVVIHVESPPIVAVTGPPQSNCGTDGILSANSPGESTGTWTLISGSGSINTVSDSTSGVNDLGWGDNVFEWTISNSCSSSSAQITLTNTGECPDEDSIAAQLFYYVPNTFTPNDDAFNKTFQPVFTSGYDPLSYTLLIFNRWGEIIFESHDANIGWDGTYGTGDQQVTVQDDVYTWKIIFTDVIHRREHVVLGHVIMIR
jgi:gliding motility-associated-like protein